MTVQDDVLTITGERTFEKEENGRKYHRVERAYGRFARSFTLPEDADGSKAAAEFNDGVLKGQLALSASSSTLWLQRDRPAGRQGMSEELMTKVQELIDTSINPAVAGHGGFVSWLT